jgi:hypothetical protein
MRVEDQRTAHQNAANAWASLQACLIGAPLQPGEDLTLRVHRVEVNRDPVPRGMSPSDMNDRWPYRCGAHAVALRDAVATFDPSGTPEHRLRDAAEAARRNLTQGQTETGLLRGHQPTFVEALWTAARDAHLPAGRATGPAAPAVSPMLLRTDFHALFTDTAGGEPIILATDRTPGTALHVAMSQHQLYGCEFLAGSDAAHAFQTARCAAMGVPIAGSQIDVSVFDADDRFQGFPPVRVGTGNDVRVAGLPGSTATAGDARPFVFRGSITDDGEVTLVDSNGTDVDAAADSGRWHIARARANGAAGFRGALTLPEASSRPDVLPDRLLYLASSEPGHGPGRVALFSRALTDNAGGLGPAVDAGTVLEDTRIAGRCRMGQDLAVALTAPGKLLVALSFGGGWQQLAQFDGHFNAINCGEHSAAITWVEARPPSIHQVRCTATGCTESQAGVASLSTVITAAGGSPQIADLDGTVLVVWSPSEGGLRMRMAPLAQLNDAHDVVLYDDHAHLGGWALTPTLYARRNNAVVAFIDGEHENDKQPFAIRIGRDGTFSAVTAAH